MTQNKILRSSLLYALLATFILNSTGCSKVSIPFMKDEEVEKKPVFTYLEFETSKDVNPDSNNRPSPIVVRIHELSSRTVFDNNDFFALYESPGKILGPDMLSQEEFEFNPGKKLEHKISLNKNTKYIGVLAAYRDIGNARWRALIKVDPANDNRILIAIDKLSVYTEEKE